MSEFQKYELQWYRDVADKWQYLDLCQDCADELYQDVKGKVNDFSPQEVAGGCEFCDDYYDPVLWRIHNND